jgi:hypothetical protein
LGRGQASEGAYNYAGNILSALLKNHFTAIFISKWGDSWVMKGKVCICRSCFPLFRRVIPASPSAVFFPVPAFPRCRSSIRYRPA